jgi:hypothetical protein
LHTIVLDAINFEAKKLMWNSENMMGANAFSTWKR